MSPLLIELGVPSFSYRVDIINYWRGSSFGSPLFQLAHYSYYSTCQIKSLCHVEQILNICPEVNKEAKNSNIYFTKQQKSDILLINNTKGVYEHVC